MIQKDKFQAFYDCNKFTELLFTEQMKVNENPILKLSNVSRVSLNSSAESRSKHKNEITHSHNQEKPMKQQGLSASPSQDDDVRGVQAEDFGDAQTDEEDLLFDCTETL